MAPANSASSGVVFRLMTSAARWIRSIRGHYRAAGRRLQLPFVTLYVAAGTAALGAIGLAILTLTEHPVAAIAPVLVLAVASEVAGNIPQSEAVHLYLPTQWWMSFHALLRPRSPPRTCCTGCSRPARPR